MMARLVTRLAALLAVTLGVTLGVTLMLSGAAYSEPPSGGPAAGSAPPAGSGFFPGLSGPVTQLSTPQLVSPQSGTSPPASKNLLISWSKVPSADFYSLVVTDMDSAAANTVVDERQWASTSYSLAPNVLKAGRQYRIAVRAKAKDGRMSAEARVEVIVADPNSPPIRVGIVLDTLRCITAQELLGDEPFLFVYRAPASTDNTKPVMQTKMPLASGMLAGQSVKVNLTTTGPVVLRGSFALDFTLSEMDVAAGVSPVDKATAIGDDVVDTEHLILVYADLAQRLPAVGASFPASMTFLNDDLFPAVTEYILYFTVTRLALQRAV